MQRVSHSAAKLLLSSASRIVPSSFSASRSVVTSTSCAADDLAGLKGFKDAEKTIEDLYFTKEDQRVLGKLLQKVKNQSELVDVHAAAGVKAAEMSELKPLITKYNISGADVEKLIKWKHTQY